MAFDQLLLMNVTDEEGYGRYRAEMTPLLHQFGGSFRFDFRVADTLKSETSHPVTRVFVISFPDQMASNEFFTDARYLAIRARHFDAAVAGFTRAGTLTSP